VTWRKTFELSCRDQPASAEAPCGVPHPKSLEKRHKGKKTKVALENEKERPMHASRHETSSSLPEGLNLRNIRINDPVSSLHLYGSYTGTFKALRPISQLYWMAVVYARLWNIAYFVQLELHSPNKVLAEREGLVKWII